MVDAIDSKSITRKGVEVRVLSPAQMQKLIVICGPTATGKSDYAVKLAKEIGGEVISADSRQVYKGLDIGSGKITKREMKGIPHHLLDVANPTRIFSVAQYKKLADKAIKDILKRGKVPILCGGTGFYINAVIFNQTFPAVSPNKTLRRALEKKSLSELQTQLQDLDIDRYHTIDINNKVRIIRAIEIAQVLGKVPAIVSHAPYDIEWIYLDFTDEELRERIHIRLLKRMKIGMVKEIRTLHEKGLSWKRLESLGLEYRYVAYYLQGKMTKEAMLKELGFAIWHYAKRQRTWFKKYAK
jgi:tRNA dimethylallyltransferase